MGFCLKFLGFIALLLAVGMGAMRSYTLKEQHVDVVDLTGKVYIVTVDGLTRGIPTTSCTFTVPMNLRKQGASAGIGKEATRILVGWNGTVIMAVRNEKKGLGVMQDIMTTTGVKDPKRLQVWNLDLTSIKNVKAFAKKFLDSKLPLHGLINNAGLVSLTNNVTADGEDITYQTNHYGHFLLTELLLPRLKATAPSRVVHVSSEAHLHGSIDFDNLRGEKSFNGFLFYCNSKLMNVLFSNKLNRVLKGTGVVSNSLHPGVVKTEFGLNNNIPEFFLKIVNPIFAFLVRTEEEGALTTVHVATNPSLTKVGGEYFSDCNIAKQNPLATNETLQDLFWEHSKEIIHKFD